MYSIGLAGKPNAGKSTFYKATTMADVDVANYPFTTIDANKGIAGVRRKCPCTELEERCGNCRDGRRYVPVELIDVAGLVPDAHKGRGLGNQFLDELSRADIIIHVVDSSGGTNPEGEPVDIGQHDPENDIDFLSTEIDQWITGILEDNLNQLIRRSKTPDFDLEDALLDVLAGLGASPNDIRETLREVDTPPIDEWNKETANELAKALRDLSKPILVTANKADIAPDEYLENLVSRFDAIPASAEYELALRNAAENELVTYHPGDSGFEIQNEISDKQRQALDSIENFIEQHGETGIQASINRAILNQLDLITVYPVEDAGKWTDGTGNVLPDAHLLPRGSTPSDLAAKIHTDIAEGYLHAINARTDRKISDSYELQEGDIIKIVSTN